MTEVEQRRITRAQNVIDQAERVRSQLLNTVDELEDFVALLWDEINTYHPNGSADAAD